MTRTWWVKRVFSTQISPSHRPRPTTRPALLCLEDRVNPAHNITIAAGGLAAIPAGALSFADLGDYIIAPAALAGGAALQANNDVVFLNDVNTGGNPLTVQAGRSIT
ncbi:MAG TPA: hypothetical protein VM533_21205, partial [Fimbriiglobus sp.]|nr:hypothetical protein [Fimbriiglobus sp.]